MKADAVIMNELTVCVRLKTLTVPLLSDKMKPLVVALTVELAVILAILIVLPLMMLSANTAVFVATEISVAIVLFILTTETLIELNRQLTLDAFTVALTV